MDSNKTIDNVEKMEEIELKDIKSDNKNQPDELAYSIEDNPPWYMCILLGFQVL